MFILHHPVSLAQRPLTTCLIFTYLRGQTALDETDRPLIDQERLAGDYNLHMNPRHPAAGRAGTAEGALLGLLPDDLKREVMQRITQKQKKQASAQLEPQKQRSKSPKAKLANIKPHDPRLALYHSHSTASNRDIYAETQHSNDMVADWEVVQPGKSKIFKPVSAANPFSHNISKDGMLGMGLTIAPGQRFSTMKQKTGSSHQELSQGDQMQPMTSNSLDERGLRIRASDEPRELGKEQYTKKFLKISDLMRAGLNKDGRGSSPEFTAPEDDMRFGGARDEMIENGTLTQTAYHQLHPNKYSDLVDREQVWRRLQYGNYRSLKQMTSERKRDSAKRQNNLSKEYKPKKPAPSSRRSTRCLVTYLRGRETKIP